ncbi:MAG: O-antigen ligase family protein [Pseudomonadota bacterium]
MAASRSLPVERALPAAAGVALGAVIALQPRLGVAALGAAAVALLGLRFPASLVAFMFLGVLFDRVGGTGAAIAGLPLTASKLAVLGSLGLWSMRALLGRDPLVRWHPVLGALLGIVAMTAVSIAMANCLALGRVSLYGLGMNVVLVAFVYTVLAEARLEGLVRFLAAALLVVFALSLAPGASGRASGTLGDPNEWGTLVLLLTPTLLGGLAGDAHPLARPLRVLLVVMAPLVVLRSGSRAAFVVGLALAPGCAFVLRRRWRELALSLATMGAAIPFALRRSSTLDRLRELLGNLEGSAIVPDYSLGERAELFHQGWDLFRDHWLLGSGPGTFPVATGFLSSTGEFRPAHNTYLEIASEQGVVGLIPFAVCAGAVAVTLWRGYREARRPADRDRVLGVSLGLAAVALMAATLGLLTFSMAYLVLGLALAVATQARRAHAGG